MMWNTRQCITHVCVYAFVHRAAETVGCRERELKREREGL